MSASIAANLLDPKTLPVFETPAAKRKATSVSEYLGAIDDWQLKSGLPDAVAPGEGFLGQHWFRGAYRHYPFQAPGVYRDEFLARARLLKIQSTDDEDRRLHLECDMMSQFRAAAAPFLETDNPIEIYFIARHFGMPTRLLDWSTNPLAALFFATETGADTESGFVYLIDARQIIPPNAMRIDASPDGKHPGERAHSAVKSMRHPHVTYAINQSFWAKPSVIQNPFILPVRPDHIPGRIVQQNSCFTMHMHKAPHPSVRSLSAIEIPKDAKDPVRKKLSQLNMNQFTAYYDMDRLSKEIQVSWGTAK